jgi:hypothetical protein
VWSTIHNVAEAMGLVLSNEQAWEIGARLATRYGAVEREAPRKELRGKKNGGGSHCFAVYPPSWRPHLEAEIRAVEAEAARQGRLPL